VRDIQHVLYRGESKRHQVRVYCVCRMDPYLGDTLIVHRETGEHIETLLEDGTWGTVPYGQMSPRQEGFPMPAGFVEALRDSIEGDLKAAQNAMLTQDEAYGHQLGLWQRIGENASRVAESSVKRIEQLEAEVAELQDQLAEEGRRTL